MIPVIYKGHAVGDGFKADIVVAHELILEIKAIAAILPIHEVQLRNCLLMSNIRVGLLPNFNVPRLVDGLRRYVVQPDRCGPFFSVIPGAPRRVR